ncbi:unnamed protein product, partial [Prorocentrum cordatum]
AGGAASAGKRRGRAVDEADKLPSKKRKQARANDETQAITRKEEVLQLDPSARASWLARAARLAKAGRLDRALLYESVASPEFVQGVTSAEGRRMYRVVHANLGLFDERQAGVLGEECALARAYKATAWAQEPPAAAAAPSAKATEAA